MDGGIEPVAIGAVVVAGGAARRMGGIDKLMLEAGGSTLLDRVLAAARPMCRRVVVVGPRRPTSVPGVEFVSEREPGGGPVPAVLAGAEVVAGDVDIVLVLAGDLPLVTTPALSRLATRLELAESAATASLDDRGAPNPLLAAYRTSAVLASGGGRGDRAARLLPDAVTIVDLGDEATLNVNRPADLRRAQLLLAGSR